MKVPPPEGSDPSGDDDRGPTLLNRQRMVPVRLLELRAFLVGLQKEVARGRSFTVCLVSDAVMRRYNRRFRGQNAPTDVLSFREGQRRRAGDVLISSETARRQARHLGHSLESEIKLLALHGLLHLLGFDHLAPRQARHMARAERRWQRRFALPEGLVGRSNQRPRKPAAL